MGTMTLSTFDRLLPWTGAVAGVAWIVQGAVARTTVDDVPSGTSARVVREHFVANHTAQGLLVLMGIALLFFATSVRSLLRSGEAREATYSSIAHAGWVVTAAAVAQMVMVGWAVVNGAADAADEAATRIVGYLHFFGWAGMGIGLATALVATGLGGLSSAVLPRWFAIGSVVLGVLGALGNAGIPPGGLVTYLLMPLWLVTASVVIARRQRVALFDPVAR